MNEKIKKLKEIIDGTDNLVFFGGAGVFYRERYSRFSEAQMDYTARNMIFRRKLSSATPFS